METIKCDYCGKTLPKEEAYEYNGIYVCPDCRSEFFVRCERCDDLIPINDAHTGFGGYLCDCCHDELFG